MIIENSKYNDIRKLFKENNKNYITKWCNENGIEDKTMLKIVWNEDNISKGYAIICFDKNFCEISEINANEILKKFYCLLKLKKNY